jgi:hypothetical protein
MRSRLFGALDKILHDHKMLVRGLVTTIRLRPVQKSGWGRMRYRKEVTWRLGRHTNMEHDRK